MKGLKAALTCCLLASLGGQPAPVHSAPAVRQGAAGPPAATQTPGRYPVLVPAGERIVLRLTTPLHTQWTKKGDRCEFATAHGIFLGLDKKLVIPPGARIRATVYKVRRKKPFQRPEVLFEFDDLVLPDGTSLPFHASIVRAISGVLAEGPDLILREGMLVETVLNQALEIPSTSRLLAPWKPSPAATPPVATSRRKVLAGLNGGGATVPLSESEENSATAENSADETYNLRVEVGLVQVETVVRDRKGRLLEHLEEADFLVFEDTAPQKILHFSRDKLPLAVALVVDSSDSITPYVEELRGAVRETLGQLKYEDQVALFIFSNDTRRLEDLTADRARIAERIAEIVPAGATNIYDAVTDAAHYLHQAAPDRRHAIILVSDNRATHLQRAGEGSAFRMALQTETVIYSIQLPGPPPPPRPRILALPVWVGDYQLVQRITHETGGEIIDLRRNGSLRRALETVIARLKLRYSLGYAPANKARDGRFRRLEVRLTPRHGQPGKHYTVHTRRGYYPLPQ